MNRRQTLCSLAGIVVTNPWMNSVSNAQGTSGAANIRWVEEVLGRMNRVKPGMTRADLLRVFTTEGGLSTGLERTYVSQDCSLFKVNVTFLAVGRSAKDKQGRVTLAEDGRDEIETISRPYIAFGVMD